jgi:class 3 adenylate cyclase
MRAYFWLVVLCGGALIVNLTATLNFGAPGGDWSAWLKVLNSAGVALAAGALAEFAFALCGRAPGRVTRFLEAALLSAWLGNLWGDLGLYNVFLLLVVASLANAMRVILAAAWAGNPEARTVVWGMCALGVALVGEVLMFFRLLPDVPGLPIAGFTLLFLSLAVSLSNRFERAHRELDALRIDLERRVEERTRALNGANRRLRRYFPARVVERILSSGEDLQPRTERREVTILFADLVAFTSYSDGADPQAVSILLNEYITAMVAEIDARGGTLDKVMGDGLMAFWGAPEPLPPGEQASRAVEAAVAMQRRLERLSDAWEVRGLRRFHARIGVHQDTVAVGDIGTAELWSFTAIGRGVNIASRLEGACPPGRVMVSDAVRGRLEGPGSFEGPVRLQLKGVKGGVDAWVLGVAADPPPAAAG